MVPIFAYFLTTTAKFNFQREDWALGWWHFLIFQDPKVLVVWQLMRQLLHWLCYVRHQVSFYLWLIGLVLKYWKVPKFHNADCLKTFLLFSTLSMIIQVSGKKCSFGSTQSVLYIKKVESFLNSIKQNRDRKLAACLDQAAVSWKFGHYYFLRDFCDALCGNYELLFWKKDFFFFHLRENRG